MADVPDAPEMAGEATPMAKWRFLMTGWFICNITGNGDKYALLVAQAALETGNFKSRAWDQGSGAWCMWFSKTGTPRANGAYGGKEPVAIYTGWNKFARMWRDRLQWDTRHGIGSPEDERSYMTAVASRWFGDPSQVPEAKTKAYVTAWKGCYDMLPAWFRFLGGPGNLMGTVVFWLVLFICLFLLYKLVRLAMRSRR